MLKFIAIVSVGVQALDLEKKLAPIKPAKIAAYSEMIRHAHDENLQDAKLQDGRVSTRVSGTCNWDQCSSCDKDHTFCTITCDSGTCECPTGAKVCTINGLACKPSSNCKCNPGAICNISYTGDSISRHGTALGAGMTMALLCLLA